MASIPKLNTLPCTLLLLTLPGCTQKRPAASPLPEAAATAPSEWRIPSGCADNLSGEYVHADAPTHRYRAEDTAPTLRLRLMTIRTESGGSAPPVDIVVARTASGFRGVVSGTGANETVNCPLQFPVEVLSCSAAGLTLRSLAALDVDDTCQLVSPPAAQEQWVVHELRRVGP